MRVKLELSELELRKLVLEYFRSKLGDLMLDEKYMIIEVKSKQNYKSEWEKADFRATYEHYEG